MPSLLGFTQSAFDPASRVRFLQFVPWLERAGWSVEHRPNRPDRQWRSGLRRRIPRGLHQRAGRALMKANRLRDVERAADSDVVFVNRDLAGGAGGVLERTLLRRNPRVVFDFDDALFTGKSLSVTRWMCRHAAWVTPGNDYLAEFASRHTDRVSVLPTVIDTDRYAVRPRNGDGTGDGAVVRVGWSGSDQSITTTLFPYLALLRDIQGRVPFDLVVIANSRPRLPVDGLRWSFVPWSPEGEGTIGDLFDVGIMPLVDDEFQRGKCGMKLLQYMAAGLPTVASPVGVNRDITEAGETGFLPRSSAEWFRDLTALVSSAALRRRMGGAGRARCEASYSIRRWAPELLGILERTRRLGT